MRVVFCFVIAMAISGSIARDSMTVDPGEGASSNIDWSKTDLLQVYCEAPGKECSGGNIGSAQFASTVRQCHTRCSVDFTCMSAFYDKSRNCQLKSKRCTAEELSDNSDGTDYYRLKKGEKCPSDRPQYSPPKIKFSNTYCMMRGKACPGHNLYKKPQNIYPLEQCLQKCSKIATCAMVDFKNNKCSPKSYACTDEELVDDPDMYNAQRLLEGVDACSPNRGPVCPTNSSPDENQQCVCNAGFAMVKGKCEQECPANSKAVGDKCECDEGFEMDSGVCKETKCARFAHKEGKECVCTWQTYADGTCGDRYCHRERFNCPGNDILFMNVDHTDDCKKACDVEDRCVSIQVRPERRECWLKFYRCDNAELKLEEGNDYARMADGEQCAPDFLPTKDYCKRPYMNCAGSDIKHTTASEEVCEYYCTMNPECLSFHWKTNLDCYIKRTVCTNDELQASALGNDYVKIDVGGSCSEYEKPKQEYCVRDNMNCAGSDIQHLTNVNTLSQCQLMCDYNSQCASIHYRKDGNCWLKSRVCQQPELAYAKDSYDAVKVAVGGSCDRIKAPENQYCLRDGKNCVGHDIVHYAGVSDLAECQRLCDYKSECLSVHVNPTGCWLKRFKCQTHELTDSANGKDAYKGACDPVVQYAFCRRDQMDCPGNDIKKYTGTSEAECEKHCEDNPECKSLRHVGTDCWIKRKACTNAEITHRNDGVDMVKIETATGSCAEYTPPPKDYCTRDMFHCPGNDIFSFNGISYEMCKLHCDYRDDCKSFAFESHTGKCWSKRVVCARDKLTFDPNLSDSVKVDPGTDCGPYIRPEGIEYCTRNDKYCPGHDIANKHPTPTFADCQYWCDFEPECKSIYYKANTHCYLKSKRCERRELQDGPGGYDSYKAPCIVEPEYDYCRRENEGCHGHDILHRGGQTEDECKALCDMYPDCKSIYYRKDQNCWLKRRVCTGEQLTPEIDGTDLVRVAKGESCAPYDPPAGQFCVRNYHYCGGSDILHRGNVPDALMCEHWCRYHPDCVSYHYKEDKNCWLERHLCTNDQLVAELPSFDAVKIAPGESCSKYSQPDNDYCTRRMSHCSGHDIYHRSGVSSLEQCQYLCDYKPECKSVHFRNDGNCWVKRVACDLDQLSFASNGVDSIKVPKGTDCSPYLPPETEYCTRENKNCGGHDIRHQAPVETIADCQYICNMRSDCKSIHYRAGSKDCWIKRKRCEDRELGDVAANDQASDSYKAPCIGKVDYDYCRRENEGCHGNDILHRGGQTEEQCKALCDMYPECVTIFFKTDGNCWIKRNRVCTGAELTPEVNGVDLVRITKGGSCDFLKPPEKKYCQRENHYCSGGDIHHRAPTPTRAMCENWCNYHPECVSYHYKEDKNCWLERHLCTNDQLVAEVPSSDWVKVDPWESCDQYQPQFQYCDRPGKQCAGHDIFHRGGVSSKEMCQRMCNLKSECKSIQYRPDGNCWVKRKRCEKRELEVFTSGALLNAVDSYKAPCIVELAYDYCRRENEGCHGNDILHRGGQTEAQCKELCDMYPECVTIFHKTDGNCWIKRNRVCDGRELTPELHGVDLVRIPKGGDCDAVTPAPKKFCERKYHYCGGSDIHHRAPTPTRAMCENWCLIHPDCVSYHYKEDKNCWLERYLCTSDQLVAEVPSSDWVKVDPNESCEPYQPKFKYCTRQARNCGGHDIFHRGGVTSQAMCEEMCNYKSECKSIHYRPDGNCWVKRYACTNAQLEVFHSGTLLQAVDAVRVGINDSCAQYQV